MRHAAPRVWAAAALLAAVSGCGYGVNVNAPSAADTTSQITNDSTGGTFQRATLTVATHLSGQDSVVGAEVGSGGGFLTHGVIAIRRQGSGGTIESDSTDGTGGAVFRQLVPGTYVVSVERLLTSADVARLDSAAADVNAFGGGGTVTVTAPAASVSVEVAAGRRGSLVISEIFAAAPTDQSANAQYQWGNFIELYNNSDTTIYLDGKVIGRGQTWFRDFADPRSCMDMAKWRNDPDGIWAHWFDAFPGTGHDHPLPPGAAVVVATDAIDHRSAFAGMLDLSHASFEFRGSNDVDNPGVPDMLDIGFAEWDPTFSGHGLDFILNASYFVADAVTVANLTHDDLPVVQPVYVRFPKDKLLDVFTTSLTAAGEATENANGFPLCGQIVNRNFDRQYAGLLDPTTQLIQSMTRKVFTTLPDGRVILLRTRSSANDFEIAPPTPGKVP